MSGAPWQVVPAPALHAAPARGHCLNSEQQFALGVAAFEIAVRVGRLRERKLAVDRDLEPATGVIREQIGVAVEHYMVGATVACDLRLFPAADGCDHPRTAQLGELRQQLPDTAGGDMHRSE